MRNNSWNHKGFCSKVIGKMSVEKTHDPIFLWLVTLFLTSSVLEPKDALQIYRNFRGEHAHKSVCDFKKVAMQFHWNKTAARVLSCVVAAYLQTVYICIYAYTTCAIYYICAYFGDCFWFLQFKNYFLHTCQRLFADKVIKIGLGKNVI